MKSLLLQGARLGRYRVGRRLGSGAMGIVHVADDLVLGRKVALKLLRTELGPETHDLVRAEAHALARLSDPRVVAVFDVGVAFDLAYIAMELVDGVDLRRRWREHTTAAERLAPVREAGLGLAAAHRAGVIHGDFKPDNVLCGRDGRTKVVDFGLARLVAPRRGGITQDDESSYGGGTPSYMAPELHAGAPVDERSDQYAFCVTAYEALTAERPFRGDDIHSLAAAKRTVPRTPQVRGVPRHVVAAILRGLDPRPQARWPTMERLLAAMVPRRATRWWFPVVTGAGVVAVLAMRRPDVACEPGDAESRGSPVETLAEADERWREAWRAACVEGDETRMACLTARRNQLRALADGLEDAEGDAIVPDDALPPDLLCETSDVGRDPSSAIALAHARGLRLAGHHTDARAQLFTAQQLARDPIDATAAQLEAGFLAVEAGDRDGARASFESAYHGAIAIGAVELAASAAIAVASSLAAEPGPTGEVWLGHARAAIERAGRPEALAVRLAAIECRFAAERGTLDDAQRACAAALDRAAARDDGEAVEGVLSNLGYAHARARDFAESLAIFRRELAMREARLGADHPANIGVLLNVGASLQATGDPAAAMVLFDRAAEIAADHGGDRHREFPRIALNRGAVAALLGRPLEAMAHTRAAVDALERQGAEAGLMVAAQYNHGIALHDLGRHAEAETAAWRALAWASEHLDADDPAHARLTDLAADTLTSRGEYARALVLHRRAARMARRTVAEADILRGQIDLGIGNDLVQLGRPDDAIAVLEGAVVGLESTDPRASPALVAALALLGQAHVATDHPCDAVPPLERAATLDDGPAITFALARSLDGCGDGRNRAISLARTARARSEASDAADSALRAEIDAWLAVRRPRI